MKNSHGAHKPVICCQVSKCEAEKSSLHSTNALLNHHNSKFRTANSAAKGQAHTDQLLQRTRKNKWIPKKTVLNKKIPYQKIKNKCITKPQKNMTLISNRIEPKRLSALVNTETAN